ncbi:N-acetylmuramate/N-acetylglucosamine kinase AmgK [Phenylobacterium immobile]|uniref:N-acetylmuramate/N-acetylglucosamine kinase AmgK n=1 Tax=Phenylobacterium immobile TaxID=21 RepID=UPI000A4929FC|nr:phosphotransferase [Phenylobacterium immobile]
MNARDDIKADFLSVHGFGEADRTPLAGDASTRAYERLRLADGSTRIFMDQPPAAESAPCPPDATPEQRRAAGYNALARLAAGRVDAFVAVAGWLRSQGLSAPEVEAHDAEQGLAVLEDLGDGLFAHEIPAGADEAALYRSATEALVVMHATTPPAVLEAQGASWPLLAFDQTALATADGLFPEWLPKLKPQLAFGEGALAEWEAIWAPIRARGEAGAAVFCHRDYHAENLIWLPERAGAARAGLIDFQDAVRAHPAWDLSMLLHDARRDVAADLEAQVLADYFELNPAADRAELTREFHALGALNIVRILGVFARLTARDGKPRYATLMPRMWGYLDRCLADPALAHLKAWLDRHVPREARR